ncbi:MAG: helix-turn-helix domain-containing protein [Lentimicrobium sp.]|nr:helix-turn-helix domain-containing protein [Lentimicrobium sp.]
MRSVLTDRSKLTRHDLWHFLPMAVYFISAVPNMFVSWAEKVEVAGLEVMNQEYMMIYKPTLLSHILPAVVIYVFRLVLILGYTIWSIVLFWNFIKYKKSSAVFTKQHFMKKWLIFVLSFTLILVVCQIFLVIRSFELRFSELFFTFNFLRLLSIIGLAGLLVTPFFFPSVLYGMPRFPEESINQQQEPNDSKRITDKPLDDKNTFETDYLNSLEQKISACMEKSRPYLQPDFSLAYLSAMIQIPVHHLAYFFREVKKEHFIDYRNRWRVQHAKNLIKEGKTSKLTLEAIGLSSGFSNRNAFRNAFKKFEGNSPAGFTSDLQK